MLFGKYQDGINILESLDLLLKSIEDRLILM